MILNSLIKLKTSNHECTIICSNITYYRVSLLNKTMSNAQDASQDTSQNTTHDTHTVHVPESKEAKIDVEDRFRSNLKKNQFIFPSFEIYGAPAGFHTYGVLGTAIKRRILDEWRKIFCNTDRDNDSFVVYEIDTPIIGPEKVFIASGHVARFTDPVVTDKDGKIERVDHYLKARIRASKDEDYIKDTLINRLDDYDNPKLQNLLELYGEPERKFGKIFEQNLMLDTKTSLTESVSYLRPETAQGLITEFKNIHRFHGETLPMGISQIGRVYRKEISPRPFIRLREFEQAEIELFHDPQESYDLPESMKSTLLNIFSAADQESSEPYHLTKAQKTLGQMVDQENKNRTLNPYIAHFMHKIKQFTDVLGIDPNRLRFRQHLKNELAHYSSDCWDLEYLVRDKSTHLTEIHPDETNWIEVIGIADRGCYDLSQHNNNPIVNTSMTVKRIFDPPVKRMVYDLKFDMKSFGKRYQKDAQILKQHLLDLERSNPHVLDLIIENNTKNHQTHIMFDNPSSHAHYNITLEPNIVQITKTEKLISSEEFIPHIIEPSFGIDRLIYATLNSLFWVRPEDSDRTVMSVTEKIAPITVSILPLFAKEVMTKHVSRVAKQIQKARPDFVIKADCSGASIGKRYSRLDEIGVPYAVTIDYQTDQDDTVTLRSRDAMTQIRVKIDQLFV